MHENINNVKSGAILFPHSLFDGTHCNSICQHHPHSKKGILYSYTLCSACVGWIGGRRRCKSQLLQQLVNAVSHALRSYSLHRFIKIFGKNVPGWDPPLVKINFWDWCTPLHIKFSHLLAVLYISCQNVEPCLAFNFKNKTLTSII